MANPKIDPFAEQIEAIDEIMKRLEPIHGQVDRMVALKSALLKWDSALLGDWRDAVAVAARRTSNDLQNDRRLAAKLLLGANSKQASTIAKALKQAKGLKAVDIRTAVKEAGGLKKLASPGHRLSKALKDRKRLAKKATKPAANGSKISP